MQSFFLKKLESKSQSRKNLVGAEKASFISYLNNEYSHLIYFKIGSNFLGLFLSSNPTNGVLMAPHSSHFFF